MRVQGVSGVGDTLKGANWESITLIHTKMYDKLAKYFTLYESVVSH